MPVVHSVLLGTYRVNIFFKEKCFINGFQSMDDWLLVLSFVEVGCLNFKAVVIPFLGQTSLTVCEKAATLRHTAFQFLILHQLFPPASCNKPCAKHF